MFSYFVVFNLFFIFPSVEKEKCSDRLTGETVTGEKLGVQSGGSDQHWAAESSTGTKQPPRILAINELWVLVINHEEASSLFFLNLLFVCYC